MTIDEVSRQYQIPIEILQQYERWALCGETKKVRGNWQYDDWDLKQLSLIVNLYDMGFKATQVESYMRLMLKEQNTQDERLHMLNIKREQMLKEIHRREKQLERLDYLRHKIRSGLETNT